MASGCSAKVPKTAPVFHPSVWGDFFIDYRPHQLQRSEEWMIERSNQLREEVNGLFDACEDVVEKMKLVDMVQHLGIQHHFEDNIITTLSSIQSVELRNHSLHEVALRFRLLRQQGFWIPLEEFNKFKYQDGGFIKDITNDPKGLLSLYNASHLLVHNEGALEEAILFARNHLESMSSNLKSPLDKQVARALQIPLPRTVQRVEALSYISEYNTEEQSYNTSILEFAKLDFNLLQRLHQKELKAITEWWKDLSREVGLGYVRDRVVECHFWSYTVYYEKDYARARMILARFLMLATMLDDTYDVHATLEECRKLNEAIQSWEESRAATLPEYLKKFFLKVLSNFKEFENALEPHEKHRNAYNIKVFQLLSGYYLQEAEWFHHNHVPSFKEQVKVSVMSAGVQAISVALLVGMGDVVTKETLDWAIGNTDAVKACGVVTRFMDDMSAFKNGRNQNDVASSVECYMKEYNVTSEVAIGKIGALVEDAWKSINQAHFKCGALLPSVQRVTNLAKSMMLFFLNKRDGYTYSKGFKETIEDHFITPIPL